MSDVKQTVLKGDDAESAFDKLEDEIKQEKIENSPYFKPQKDMTHKVTFSGWEIGTKSFVQKDANNNEIIVNGAKVMEEKKCLILWVDTIDGEDTSKKGPEGAKYPGKEWTITSSSLITQMRLHCTTGDNILKKKYKIRRTGEKFQTKYAVAEEGDR